MERERKGGTDGRMDGWRDKEKEGGREERRVGLWVHAGAGL